MKFISKNANLRIVLRHSMPAEPMTGRLAVPGLYIKFENGIANVNNEEHVTMMLAHSGFNSDYIQVKEDQLDPYKNVRKESEPDHAITEFEHGRAEKVKGSSHNVRLDPKLKNAAVEMAKEMAKEMAPQLAKDMLLEMARQRKATKVQEENTRGAASPEKSEPDKKLNVPENEGAVITESSDPAEFKCSCGKVAKSKAGLIAHQRNCEEFKNEN
jgi:hypothetical protein